MSLRLNLVNIYYTTVYSSSLIVHQCSACSLELKEVRTLPSSKTCQNFSSSLRATVKGVVGLVAMLLLYYKLFYRNSPTRNICIVILIYHKLTCLDMTINLNLRVIFSIKNLRPKNIIVLIFFPEGY